MLSWNLNCSQKRVVPKKQNIIYQCFQLKLGTYGYTFLDKDSQSTLMKKILLIKRAIHLIWKSHSRASSNSLLCAIIARNHLPIFKTFSNFLNFCPNFQILCQFLPLFNVFCPFFALFMKNHPHTLLSRIGLA